LDKHLADRSFEPLDREAHEGLPHLEGLGRPAEAPLPRHRVQAFKMPQLDLLHS
jgi:hypothetical protein